MSVDVVMPQMGESIAEGTIVRWIKKVGDTIDKDEPLFEISTDKVDAEIPSPGAGVLLEISVKEGETVPVNSVVARIGASGEKLAPAPASAPAATVRPAPAGVEVVEAELLELPKDELEASLDKIDEVYSKVAVKEEIRPLDRAMTSEFEHNIEEFRHEHHIHPEAGGDQPRPSGKAAAGTMAAPAPAAAAPAASAPLTLADVRRTRSSPVVRKIAKEHGVDFTQLNGTGIAGRVTKKDILAAIESGAAASAGPALPARPAPPARPATPALPAFGPLVDRVEKMGVMRKKIAEHMITSIRTSAHVYSAYEVDFSRLDQIRQKKKAEYEKMGAKLTYTAFIAKATIDTIRQFPFSNATIDGENIVYKRDINLGIAVALEQGLIVPIIKKADEKNMLGICRALQDLASRARSKKLNPEEVQGGTFTITNPGIFGALFGLPIISQPQVAILGVGSIDKRVVVVDDMIAVRPMCYLTLGYDHRLIDGADAGRFLLALKERLQNFDEKDV